jgi:Tol biopolymer transport system component
LGDVIVYSHFSRDPGDTIYPTGLYTIEPSGLRRRLVVEGFADNPDWSPDGTKICFNDGDSFSIEANGEGLTQLTSVGTAFFPSWSPCGQFIAFDTPYQDPAGANAIWILALGDLSLKDISEHGTGEWRDPDWSPDGTKIAHFHYIGVGTPEFFMMDSAGQSGNRLTFNNVFDLYPTFSPDAQSIAWTSGTSQDEVWVMENNGSNQRRITSGQKPSWSPDGQQLVYSAPKNNKIVLFVVTISTGEIVQITE